MHKFLVRAASGIVYAAVIICAIVYGGWALWALAIAFAVIGICELDRMAMGFSTKTAPVFIIDILSVLSLLCLALCRYSIIIWIILQVAREITVYRLHRNDPGQRISFDYAPVYLGLPFCFMVFDVFNRLPLLIFAMLWLNDSGAYIVGSLMGRNKLCPSISPNKTWEGFFGGVVITLAGTWALQHWCPSFFGLEGYSLGIWMALAGCACVFGTIGDLIESKIKRLYGVKDSGNWIPGHGGLLDRIDSFLIAFPVAFLLLIIID